MKLSIIIPTYNEAAFIVTLINFLKQHSNKHCEEIIIIDGGSTDNTCNIAAQAGAKVFSSCAGRAAQMNYGAGQAKGDVLYFIHADCLPPPTFTKNIHSAIEQGYDLGRYKTKFDSGKTMLKINAWFTRFDLFVCMGGDQTLFIKRLLFEKLGGFKQDMKIMEEYEFCERARKAGRYKILNGAALISARKYETNSWLKVQLANSAIVNMYRKGASQKAMAERYKQLLNCR